MIVRPRHLALTLLGAAACLACRASDQIRSEERAAIADSLRALVTGAYDFSSPDATAQLLSLYPDSGRVISAAAGSVTTTRAALAAEISGFWQRVGRNMQEPRFVLGSSYVDVITRDAAVMTFTYSIPHRTPAGVPHTVGGAWTALWRRQAGRWTIVQEHLSDAPEAAATTTPPEPQPDSAVVPMAHRH
jgi:ketosteroid isomerase-like protein